MSLACGEEGDLPINHEIEAIPESSSEDNIVEVLTAGPKVNCCRFTNDGRYLIISTIRGYRIFQVKDNGDCALEYETDNRFSTGLIQRTLSFPIVSFVSTTDPSNLYVEDYKDEAVIAKLTYYGPVRDILANHSTLVVAVNAKVFLYTLDGIELTKCTHLNSIDNNADSTIALSSDRTNNYLAYCVAKFLGCVIVHHVDKQLVTARIQAHKTQVTCMTFDSEGTRLATASERGTVIRVFRLPSGDITHQFRRGLRSVVMNSLFFSPDAYCLLSISETGNLHIFQLRTCWDRKSETAESMKSWTGLLSGLISNYVVRSYTSLLSAVTGVEHPIEEERSVLLIATPVSGEQRLICHHGKHHFTYNMLICTKYGELYVCKVNVLKKSWYAGKSVSFAYDSQEKRTRDVLQPAAADNANKAERPPNCCDLNEKPLPSQFTEDELLKFSHE